MYNIHCVYTHATWLLMFVYTPGLPRNPHSVSPKLTTPTRVLRPLMEVTRPPRRTKPVFCTLVRYILCPLTAAISGAGVCYAASREAWAAMGANLVSEHVPIVRRFAQPGINNLNKASID